MHEHFDAEGRYTGRTVITREPEWDEESRGRAVRLAEYEAGLCACGCGLPAAAAHDPDQAFLVDTFTCRARKAMKIQQRNDEAAAKKDNLADGWDDGRYYYAVPHNED